MENQPNFDEKTNLQIQRLMETILTERFSDLDKDYMACIELLHISESESYLYGTAFAYAYLGDCFIGKNDGANASFNLFRAKELCEKHRFFDLLSYVFTWLGIYYEMQNDRQMAVHYNLDALDFAEKNHDLLRQSILLNNIAFQFQSCGSYDAAKEYYQKAFQCFYKSKNLGMEDYYFSHLTANMVSVCCLLNQIDEAKRYYTLLKEFRQSEENQNQFYICELIIHSAIGEMDVVRKSVDKFLLETEREPKNPYQYFEIFTYVADSLIRLNEQEYAQKILTTLEKLCREDEYGRKLKVQYVWMRFYGKFGTQEEKNKAYKQFYVLRQKSDDVLNQNLADGLLTEIKLRESIRKNQEMEKAKEQLEDEVQLDELTLLYNRRSFRKLTEQAAVDAEVHTLSFIMIDVDYFKQYNDTYGHAQGDNALRSVAECITRTSDNSVSNFRYGGDEFISMCRNKTADEVAQYIEALRQLLRQKHIPHETSLCSKYISLSIGYSVFERKGTAEFDVAKMIEAADAALYRSKERGRNSYCRYSADMQMA